jgi:hypothetical protein
MNFQESTVLGLIAIDKPLQQKVALIICAMFGIGLILGVLSSFLLISQPLTDIYMTKYNQLTKNDTLRCYDITNITYPLMIDKKYLKEYCKQAYCPNDFIGGQIG